jgi:hypothetical protein
MSYHDILRQKIPYQRNTLQHFEDFELIIDYSESVKSSVALNARTPPSYRLTGTNALETGPLQ